MEARPPVIVIIICTLLILWPVYIAHERNPTITSGADMFQDTHQTGRPHPQTGQLGRLPGVPEIVYTIPQELYRKAQNQQTQLTDAERQLLLSRGDLVGKALAQPSLMTEEERYELKGRPPPNVVRDRIKIASNGEVSTLAELVKKAGPDASGLNEAEEDLISRNFYEETIRERLEQGYSYKWTPGAMEAMQVWNYCAELGFVEEEKVIIAAITRARRREREKKKAPYLAAVIAKKAEKEAQTNTLEALQMKEEVRALEKANLAIKDDDLTIREISELILMVELDSELGDLEKDELKRVLEEKKAQDYAKCSLAPNPKTKLDSDFNFKKKKIVKIISELDKQLEELQAKKSQEDEIKGKIEDIYAKWSGIIRNYKVASESIRTETATQSQPFLVENEVQQELIQTERKVIMSRKFQLEKRLEQMGKDDVGTIELEQRIKDGIARLRALNDKSRELLHTLRSGHGTARTPKPHQRNPSNTLPIMEQNRKT